MFVVQKHAHHKATKHGENANQVRRHRRQENHGQYDAQQITGQSTISWAGPAYQPFQDWSDDIPTAKHEANDKQDFESEAAGIKIGYGQSGDQGQ